MKTCSWPFLFQVKNKAKTIKIVQARRRLLCVRCIFFAYRQENLGPFFKLLWILKLENLVKLKIATFISQIRNKGNNIPHLFSELLLPVSNTHSHSTRYATQDNYYRIHARANYVKFSFKFFASKLWESMPMSLKLLPPNSFRAHYKLHLLSEQ